MESPHAVDMFSIYLAFRSGERNFTGDIKAGVGSLYWCHCAKILNILYAYLIQLD